MGDEYFQTIEEIIKRAKTINSSFDNLSTQEQYEFINNKIESMEKEELEFYYDSKFGWPYNSKEFIKNNIYG